MWKEKIIISSNYWLIYLLWVHPHQFDECPIPICCSHDKWNFLPCKTGIILAGR